MNIRNGSFLQVVLRTRFFVVVLVMLFGLFFFVHYALTVGATNESTDFSIANQATTSPSKVATTSDTIPVPVSGIVVPAEQIDVRAKTNGVLSTLYPTEGALVSMGTPLFQQSLPVVAAREQAAIAEGERQRTVAALETEQSEYRASQARVDHRSTTELAALRKQSEATALETQRQTLEVAIEKSLATLTSVLDFINQQRTYFLLRERQQYQAVVQELYGGLPNFLVGSLRYPTQDSADLIEVLGNKPLSSDELAGIAVALDIEMTALLEVLQSAEVEFYDDEASARARGVLDEYESVRQSLLEVRSELRLAEGELWSQILSSEQDVVAAESKAEVAEIDRKRQQQLVRWQQTLENIVADVAQAEVAIIQAEQGQGQVSAPWPGVVEDVYVDAGEYVTAGTPILRMYSEQGREIHVNVPIEQGSKIAPGASLFHDGEVIGVLDRRTVKASSGRVALYVTITDSTIELGSVVRGVFQVPLSEGQELLSRGQVQFDTFGPYKEVEGTKQRLQIVQDIGDQYLVRVQQ